MKKIIILGSTGSIGRATLDVVRHNPDKLKIVGLSTKGNIKLLQRQIEEFKPTAIAIGEETEPINWEGKTYPGIDGLTTLVTKTEADLVVSALVGAVGLRPTLAAILAKRDIALANKEILVMAGQIVMNEVRRQGVRLVPIDSEHSGLWQCLDNRNHKEIRQITITASGGPFYHKKELDLKKVSLEEALAHPTWQMGQKISIDSSTLMNKGFEVIEASILFGIPLDKISIVIHPESIVHAMVEFIDGTILAHMHMPDMRIPIQYALSVPSRWNNGFGGLDLTKVSALNFSRPDHAKFPAVRLAYSAGFTGGTMPAVLSASDEVSVEKFLNKQISFTDIIPIIDKVMHRHKPLENPTIDEIITADNWAREETLKECSKTQISTDEKRRLAQMRNTD